MEKMYVVNQTAGAGRAAKVWQSLVTDHPHIQEHAFLTSSPGDGERLAYEARQKGYDAVIAVGGDGTLNEVVNGIVSSRSDIAVGQIPCGTGNDFARSVGLSRKPQVAFQTCQQSKTIPMDVGTINGRAFINVAGFGFDAAVAQTVSKRAQGSKSQGMIPYLRAVFRVLRTYKSEMMHITLDDEPVSQRVFLGAIGNGSTYGGGMQICPQAAVDDGLFHVCLAGDFTSFEAVLSLVRVFWGGHIHHPKCSYKTARRVTVSGSKDVLVHADGQMIGTLPITLTILPNAIRFITP